MKPPNNALPTPHLSNEAELQRLIEETVLPLCGLQRLSSSQRGGGRLGFIDTTAVDGAGNPYLFEYKWDLVDTNTLNQVAGYVNWLHENRPQLADEVRERCRRGLSANRVHAIIVGHRFAPSATTPEIDADLTFWRYGQSADGTVYLRHVERSEVARGTVGDAAPPEPNKDHYLTEHLTRTQPSAAAAYGSLAAGLQQLAFERKVFGKPRVRFTRSNVTVDITFDKEGVRVLCKPAKRLSWTCLLITPAEVHDLVAEIVAVLNDG